MKCINIQEPLRRKKGKTEANSKKLASFKYSISGEPVCKKTLLDTYSLTARRLQTLQNKMKEGVDIPRDKRGKHNNRPHTISQGARDLIKEHISSFPKQPSHYSRGKSDKECLNPELNLSKMYRLFKEKYPEMRLSKAVYQEVFCNNFNLRFGTPRSDTCKYCDLLYNRLISAPTEEERKKVQTGSELHHRRAESAYIFLKNDTNLPNDSNTVVLCVDLQQVMFCPTLTHSSMFYQRQLSCYNFAVHNLSDNKVTMSLWDETIAKRGSAEIASCLFRYVTGK